MPSIDVRSAGTGLMEWPVRRWLVAGFSALALALAMGVPTGVVQTGFYTRMTPVTWWDYPVWIATAALGGLLAATYVWVERPVDPATDHSRRSVAATLISTFAIGCPVCNKLVVALIGVSGAMSYWAPLQPVLGVLSIAVLAGALVVRLQGAVRCLVPSAD